MAEFKHLPVILLVGNDRQKYFFAQEWLKQSRFKTWEAVNVFDALEGISDFTLRSRPDVILLRVESVKDDFRLLSELLLNGGMDELEFPIFALSDRGSLVDRSGLFEGGLAEIKEKLEKIVPRRTTAPGTM
jgi:hypothetical protein